MTPDWSTVGAVIGAMAPLAGVPLTMIALYLRAIREAQEQHESGEGRRMGVVEADIRRVAERLDQVERGYATKDEWLRESLRSREQLERLTEMMTDVRSKLDTSQGLAAQVAEATRAMVELTRMLVELHAEAA